MGHFGVKTRPRVFVSTTMCRLLGIIASEPTEFRLVLREAPRSLAHLSREHRDGWGIAIHEASRATDGGTGWTVQKGVACAGEDTHFHDVAVGARGEVLVAHIRQRTVGQTSLDNTHPFQAGPWIFAHNGTIKDLDHVRAGVSAERGGAIRGDTDSELFFANLLTKMDALGLSTGPASSELDTLVVETMKTLRERPDFGAFNILLTDGKTMYAHRFGRSLYLLERGPDDTVRPSRSSRDGTIVETPWSQRRQAVIVASERLTDEPWQEIEDGTLLRVDRFPVPHWRRLELPRKAA
ncbi:MAG: class II glutamine amidotransferase [Polyangiaceae bacterium]